MMQVVGAMLDAMGGQCTRNCHPCVPPFSSHCVARELIRPQTDSLVSTYACPDADAMRNAFEEVPAWIENLSENAPRWRVRHCGDRRVGLAGV